MKKKIEAKITTDSIDPRGNRLITYLATFPRFILPELGYPQNVFKEFCK